MRKKQKTYKGKALTGAGTHFVQIELTPVPIIVDKEKMRDVKISIIELDGDNYLVMLEDNIKGMIKIDEDELEFWRRGG